MEERKSRTSKVFNKTEIPFSTFCLWQASFLECSQSRYDARQRQQVQVLRRTGRHSRYLSWSTLAEWISHRYQTRNPLGSSGGGDLRGRQTLRIFSDYQGPSAEQLLTVPQCSIGCAGRTKQVGCLLRKAVRGGRGVDWADHGQRRLGAVGGAAGVSAGSFPQGDACATFNNYGSALPPISLINWGRGRN